MNYKYEKFILKYSLNYYLFYFYVLSDVFLKNLVVDHILTQLIIVDHI